jgi:hypothetical protein
MPHGRVGLPTTTALSRRSPTTTVRHRRDREATYALDTFVASPAVTQLPGSEIARDIARLGYSAAADPRTEHEARRRPLSPTALSHRRPQAAQRMLFPSTSADEREGGRSLTCCQTPGTSPQFILRSSAIYAIWSLLAKPRITRCVEIDL